MYMLTILILVFYSIFKNILLLKVFALQIHLRSRKLFGIKNRAVKKKFYFYSKKTFILLSQ